MVISHHSRIDLYATYVPGIIGDYSPQVMRAACEVIFPLVTGHLLIDGNQKDQSWFAGHQNIRFWSTGCDLDFFHPSKKDPKALGDFLGRFFGGVLPLFDVFFLGVRVGVFGVASGGDDLGIDGLMMWFYTCSGQIIATCSRRLVTLNCGEK